MSPQSAGGWGLLGLLLAACAASGPSAGPADAAWTEKACSTGEGDCVTFLCDEDACGVYWCKDVEPGPVLLAYKGGIVAPPGSGPRRNWGRRQGKSGNAPPLFIIPWSFHDRPEKLPSELAKIRDPIKHHLFPQEPLLAAWFKQQGIHVHRFTMVLERQVHQRLHRGPSGGAWNAAWRDFVRTRPRATEAEIWEQTVKMIYQFEIMGPIVPYHWRVRPPAPPSPKR